VQPSLREARSSDCDAIDALATKLVGFAADRRYLYQQVLADADHHLIVAEGDEGLVGFAHLLVYEDLSHGALAGELLALIVAEDYRRRGIGEALLRAVFRTAEQRGVGELHINTEPGNKAAQKLYAKLGAHIVGVQMEVDLSAAR